ncbi:MAG: succinate-semialdehyde dehydrogenase [Candidatus Nitrosocaldaceae archaeon]|nr:MAG: succinate-semialdehyde dehydrogenase [Candidatus Nitrosocaldaceae archaeon]
MDKIRTINPATEELIEEYEQASIEEVKDKVRRAKEAFKEWRRDIHKRADYLYEFARVLRERKEELARLATIEMGKVIKEARSEVEKCAWVSEFFADNTEAFLHEEVINTDARKSIVRFEPLGVIGSIMPWNFPYWQAIRFAAPSLMAGNTIILKPASLTPACGLKIKEIFEEIGAKDIFNTVIGRSNVANALIDADTDGITFTGSVNAGGKVASRATSHVKKCVLELGGSDPFIVCEDADIDKAANGAVKGRFINNGQSCIASKRFLVVKSVADEFIEKFVSNAEKLRVGDPLSDQTDLGPLSSQDALENIEDIVADTVKNGGEILTGGERVGSKGYFYKPTLITNINPKMRIFREEVFGPVAPIMVVEDEKEAIKFANDSDFGLGASIWTRDLDKAERLSREIESGMVTINNVVVSDPRVPFGGVKKSGFGRELSRYGLLEFVNIKNVRFYDELIHHHHVE